MWDIYLNFSSAERNIEEVLENAKSDQNFWKRGKSAARYKKC